MDDLFVLLARTRAVVEAEQRARNAPLLALMLDEPPAQLWWPGTALGWAGAEEPWRGRPGWPESERLARHQADWLYATTPGGGQLRTRGDQSWYRGCCWHCGWLGPEHVDDGWLDQAGGTTALADALDHAHDGWRDLPLVRRPAAVVQAAMSGQSKAMDEWAHRLERALPKGWLARGGPIRTVRVDEWRARPVRSGAPGGGWDMPGRVESRKSTAEPVAMVYVASDRTPWNDGGWVLGEDGEVASVSTIRRERARVEREAREAERAEATAQRVDRARTLLARAEEAYARSPMEELATRIVALRVAAGLAEPEDDDYEDEWDDEDGDEV
jgi:hypothetical protein